MALIPKTMFLNRYYQVHYNKPNNSTKSTFEYNIRQDMFDCLFKSLDFFSAYYLSPGITHGGFIHDNYWYRVLKLFGAIEL